MTPRRQAPDGGPAGAGVLLRTHWSKRTDPAAFLNVHDDGPHSPGFHQDASALLAHERDVLGVGVETVGTDAGQAGGFDPPLKIVDGSGSPLRVLALAPA